MEAVSHFGQLRKQTSRLRKQGGGAQAFVDKFRYNAKRASLVQSRIKAIERLGTVQVTEEDPECVPECPCIPTLILLASCCPFMKD